MAKYQIRVQKGTNLALMEFIKNKGLTVGEFGKTLGLTKSTASRILHNKILLGKAYKIKISKKFEVDSRELFPVEGED